MPIEREDGGAPGSFDVDHRDAKISNVGEGLDVIGRRLDHRHAIKNDFAARQVLPARTRMAI
jgi:hypothetical protein